MHDYISLVISLFSLAVACAAFAVNQKWKKLEFVGQEVRNFRRDPLNRDAMKMLDWNKAYYLHPQLFEDGSPKQIKIDDAAILEGLGKINGKQSYSVESKYVRDCFDQFFDSLEVLETHIEQKLVPFEQYQPYFKYYVDIMMNKTNKRKSAEVKAAFLEHMNAFGYDKALTFCNRYIF